MPSTVFRISLLLAVLGLGIYWGYLWLGGGPPVAALDVQVPGFDFLGRTEPVTLEPEMGPIRVQLEARTGTEEGSDREFGYQIQVLRKGDPVWSRSHSVTRADLRPRGGALPTAGQRRAPSGRQPQQTVILPVGEFAVPAPDLYEVSVTVWRDAPGQHHDLRLVLRRHRGEPDLLWLFLLGGAPPLLGFLSSRALRGRGW